MSGSYDKTLKIWDINSGRCKLTLRYVSLRVNRYDPKFSDRLANANSANPDQTAPKGAV